MLKAWAICLAIGLLFCLAFGLGRYALAPAGLYADWTVQGVSHDPHHYRWFFQVPLLGWRMLAALGVLVGLLNAILVVPIVAIGTALLLWLFPRLKTRLLTMKPAWLWPSIFALGFVSGVVETILIGRNPGVP
ncbi:MAG: hypothetical protein WA814_02265 [Candidatus Baltobacteraceae bacterium]